jgi:glycerophosphoryl diester phosphodiesterase
MSASRCVLAVALATILSAGAAAQPPDPRVAVVQKRISELAPYARLPACRERAEEARWTAVGTPDKGLAKPLISAHRGGNTLAPENTLAAYEAAFALGVDFIEVDVRETKDGVFVANHDDTVDRTTNGTGKVADLTLAEIRALNAADYAPWKGGPFDPSRIATLEEVLALAKRAGAGLELDIKIGDRYDRIAALVARYGLTETSIFNSQSPDTLKAAPGARLIYNRNNWEPPGLLYQAAKTSYVFGSKLAEYTPEAIAAIHDACGVVMPHAYDAGGAQEAAQFLAARAIGADGVQTNQPEVIVAAAGLKVTSRLKTGKDETGEPAVCLVNARNDMGVIGKTLTLQRAGQPTARLTTVQHGCARLPREARGAEVSFDGDAAVGPARLRL